MYYLQSRYYSPDWGRFINADSADVMKGIAEIVTKNTSMLNIELLYTNMFAYCANNAINSSDPYGYGTLNITLSKEFRRDLFKSGLTAMAAVIAGFIVFCLPELVPIYRVLVPVIAAALGAVVGGVISRNYIVNDKHIKITRWWLPNFKYKF